MIQSGSSTPFHWKPIHLIILLAIFQLLAALLTDGFAFSFDEAMWQYIGRNWFRHGLTPYSGGIDNKSPLIFAIFGFSDWLFGVNYWFPRVLGTVIQSVGIYYLYLIARNWYGERAGRFTIIIYGLSLMWRIVDGKFVALTETYAIAFLIISFYQFLFAQRKWQYFLSGFIAAIALAFRFSAAFGIGALTISFVRKKPVEIFRFLAGFFTGMIFWILIARLAGISMNDFITYAFTDNFGKGSATDHSLLWRIESLFSSLFYSEMVIFYPAIVGYFIYRKKLDFLGIWLMCEFIGLNIIGIYARAHLKNFLPVFSLMTAITINQLVETYKISPRSIMIMVWICFFPKLIEPFVSFKKLFVRREEDATKYCNPPFSPVDDHAKKLMGQWVKAHTDPSELVLVAGFGAMVQAYSERLAPGVYFNVTQTKMARERYINDILTNKPGMVLVPISVNYSAEVDEEIRAFIDNFTRENYSQMGCMYGYKIFLIRK